MDPRTPRRPAPLAGARLSYVFVDVVDLATMRAFYVETLGLPVLFESPGECVFVRPDGGGPAVALYPGRTTARGPGPVLIALDVVDLGASRAALEARGVELSTPTDVPGGRAVFFSDPEGNRLELHEPG